MKIYIPSVLLLFASCTTVSNDGADSTQVAIDTLAGADFIEEADYSKELDTTYTEIIQQSRFDAPQIDRRRAYVYRVEGLRVFGSAKGADPIGQLDYRSGVSLLQPLVNNASSDTTSMENLLGHFVEISFNGKQGYVFSGYLLNLPVPDDDVAMADYFLNTLQLTKPAERVTHECDCDDMRSEADYKYEFGITVRVGSYFEGYNNYVDFDKDMTIQEVYLLARLLLPHFLEPLAKYPAGPYKEEKENGAGVEVISNGDGITAIVIVTGEGCYEEESIRITQEGNVRLSANGGC
jgi:hypothetical protein